MRKLITYLFLIVLVLTSLGLLYDSLTMAKYQGEITPRFNGKTFNSPSYAKKKWGDLLKWQLNSDKGPWQHLKLSHKPKVVERVDSSSPRITLINHSSVLIQLAGINILTDPIWSNHTGPYGRFGPSRFKAPGIPFEQLPPIDLVIVSHSHYDHMDLPTLERLDQSFAPVFIVGLGNAQNLAKVGIDQVVELDWWQDYAVNDVISIVATPAAHWSKRTALDTNRTLWASYALLENQQHRVFFAGDTGYGEHFSKINRRLGAPDVSLMPIGAYLPRWFMKDNHISPAEALIATSDLGCNVMIPIHYNTFALGDDGQDLPLKDLSQANYEFDAIEVIILDNGQSTQLDQSPEK